MLRSIAILGFPLLLALTAQGCTGAVYPRCNNDNDCRGHGEVCIQGRCQQCRADSDCKDGKKCTNNKCLAVGECDTNGDCGHDEHCVARRCVASDACDETHPCADGRPCVEGHCRASDDEDPSLRDNQGKTCAFEPVYFAFDSSTIEPAAQTSLQADAECLRKEGSARFVLIGRADPRGTTEYNLALGERRARAVQRYLVTLGAEEGRIVVSSEGSEAATGTDEATWVKDRRVDFRPRD